MTTDIKYSRMKVQQRNAMHQKMLNQKYFSTTMLLNISAAQTFWEADRVGRFKSGRFESLISITI